MRTWFMEVLTGADSASTLGLLNDRSVGLRDALRNGIVFCGGLNALRPGSIKRMPKPPAASATPSA